MKIRLAQHAEGEVHRIGDALGRRRLDRRLELHAVALDQIGLPARVQAALAAELPVVVVGGVEGNVRVRDQVAERARAFERAREVALAEGLDQAAVDLFDLPGQAALGRDVLAEAGDVLGLHPRDRLERIGAAEGVQVEEVIGVARSGALEVRRDGLLGQVGGVGLEHVAQGLGQGTHRLAPNQAVAGESPGPCGRGEEGEDEGGGRGQDVAQRRPRGARPQPSLGSRHAGVTSSSR